MLKNYFKRFKKTKILARSQTLLPWMLGKNFQVHDGKRFVLLEVVRLRLYKKAGEFIQTRKLPIHKKKKRR